MQIFMMLRYIKIFMCKIAYLFILNVIFYNNFDVDAGQCNSSRLIYNNKSHFLGNILYVKSKICSVCQIQGLNISLWNRNNKKSILLEFSLKLSLNTLTNLSKCS